MRMKSSLRLILNGLVIITLFSAVNCYSQELQQEFEVRSGVELNYRLNKQIRFDLEPQLRWTGGEWLNEYHANFGVRYRPVDFLSLFARYRIIGEIQEDRSTTIAGRYQCSLNLAKEIDRFEPEFRFSYTNYADDQFLSGQFFQYRGSLAYDIKGVKLTPEIMFSVYQNLEQKDVVKYRSRLNLVYRLSKSVSIKAGYAYEYFMLRPLDRHLLMFGADLDLN